MEILVSGNNHNISNLAFSLCMSVECFAKVQDTAMSLPHCSHSSHSLLRQPSHVGLSYHCLIQPSGSQYLHKSYSLSPVALQHHTKTNNALLHAEWPFKLVHASPLYHKENLCSLGKYKSPITNYNSTLNRSKGASDIQYSSFNMEFILQNCSRWGK